MSSICFILLTHIILYSFVVVSLSLSLSLWYRMNHSSPSLTFFDVLDFAFSDFRQLFRRWFLTSPTIPNEEQKVLRREVKERTKVEEAADRKALASAATKIRDDKIAVRKIRDDKFAVASAARKIRDEKMALASTATKIRDDKIAVALAARKIRDDNKIAEPNHDLSSWDSKTKLTVKNNCIIFAIFKEQINSS